MTARDPYGEIDLSGRDREEGEEEGLDLQRFKETAGFMWRAPRRRPRLAAIVFAVVATLGVTVAVTMPRTYNSQVKLLAERDLVAANLTNPSRAVPRDAENLTRNVPDTILRRENIIALVKELNLIARWRASRSGALRLKDEIFGLLWGPPTEAEELLSMAQTLEKRLTVKADDSTVTISVDWSDPQLAYEIVSLVQKNFVESKYDSDVDAIQRAISALEESSKTQAEQVDSALAAYQALQSEPPVPPPPTPTAQASNPGPAQAPVYVPRPAPSPAPDPDLTKALDDKRREIRAADDERQRQIATVKQQLLQYQLTLTPLHPTVRALQEQLNSLSEPSPELAHLKADEAALMAQIAPTPSASAVAPTPRYWVPPAAATAPAAAANSPYREDPAATLAHSRLESAIHRYQDVMLHLDEARIELRVARTASNYSVVTPAEVPRSPKKPIAPLVAMGSVLFAFLFAFAGAAAADWHAGKVLEAWEVRRRLKLDVLGNLDLPL